MKQLVCFLLLIHATFSITEDQLSWHRLGPSAGNISQIVPDRDHPQIWYLVESQFKRLYRSTDNGENWKYTGLNDVENILVHSASSELFVVRFSGNPRKFSLFSSKDFARTFQLRSANAPRRIFDHLSDPKILWGSGVENPYELSVSVDGGSHWKNFNNLPYKFEKKYEFDGWQLNPSEYYLFSVLVSPLDQKTVYVSTEVFFELGCSGYSISLELVSRNLGKTWSAAEVPAVRYIYDKAFPTRAFSVNDWEGIRTLTSQGWKELSTKRFRDIASVPGSMNFLYGIFDGRQWLSRDGGREWRSIDIGPAGKATTIVARSFPQGTLLAGTAGGGVYVIDDRSSWRAAKGLHEAKVPEVSTSAGSSIVYATAGNDDWFLFRSTDSGATWKNITDNFQALKQRHNYPQLFVNPTNAKHLFAVVWNKMYVSFDSGNTWNPLTQPQLSRVFFVPDSNFIYFSRPGSGHLYRSPDGGRTIFELPTEYGYRNNAIYDLAVDPFNGDFFVATIRGLFRSKGPLQKPEQIATDISSDCWHCSSFDQIIALPVKGKLLATTNGRLYKSTNHGVSWQKLSAGVYKIYVADNTGMHLYHIAGRLNESFDGGITWNNASTSIHPRLDPYFEQYVFTMSDPRYRPIYVGTSLGVFQGK